MKIILYWNGEPYMTVRHTKKEKKLPVKFYIDYYSILADKDAGVWRKNEE